MKYLVMKNKECKEFSSMRECARFLDQCYTYVIKRAIVNGTSINGWFIDEKIEDENDTPKVPSEKNFDKISKEYVEKLQKQNQLLRRRINSQKLIFQKFQELAKIIEELGASGSNLQL